MANATAGDLLMSRLILDADVNAAVEAYLSDLTTGMHSFGPSYTLDLAEAARGDAQVQEMLARSDASPVIVTSAISAAILLARPIKTISPNELHENTSLSELGAAAAEPSPQI